MPRIEYRVVGASRALIQLRKIAKRKKRTERVGKEAAARLRAVVARARASQGGGNG